MNITRILLVDDDPDDRLFFKEALKETGIESKLITEENGAKAIEYLSSSHQVPHIIFLDINMPRMNGKECLKKIRADKNLKYVSIVMLSTSSYQKDIEDTFLEGANLYVPKPIFFKDEVVYLKTILSLYKQKRLFKTNKENYVLKKI